MAMRALFVSLLPALAAAACSGKQVRVGTFGDSNPEALVVMTDWLNDCWTSPTTTSSTVCAECWTFYRQSSGIYSIQKLDSEDLDIALLGSTPYAAAAARRGWAALARRASVAEAGAAAARRRRARRPSLRRRKSARPRLNISRGTMAATEESYVDGECDGPGPPASRRRD